ncbi:DUF2959 domain-containing protein [Shewanella sp. NIFS-20-20]|uniref:DUF2959 domain-containing protein n=1 Tax=Shewanella sp. NIFS-20-20 TaxID=2853806 RepID=UPI001C493398|nr:DUF2959 domain-containing protein [Shewanella sp. NIFS-20-20]MBV7315615.1 DUF2959 domain-containing protein [Shewanella sp. NIFS-20-20]
MNFRLIAFSLVTAMSLAGCQSAYYGAMEKVGYHKRDIMVDRVEAATEAQEEAKQEFSSALEEMQSLILHDGGDLQRAYENASDEYESAQSAADEVTDRINKVEDVAEALFDEWQTEIGEISKASLRRASESKLRATRQHYQQMLRSMRRAEAKMQPVLTTMKDNMLYLKHNLNAQAIGAIKGEFSRLQADISGLISDMNASIAASNQFISNMKP